MRCNSMCRPAVKDSVGMHEGSDVLAVQCSAVQVIDRNDFVPVSYLRSYLTGVHFLALL